MNQREKEAYLREYGMAKSKGKPFFPYAVSKDAAMACVVMAVIIALALIIGRPLGPKADPTTTTYVPRPEWYFFFLFELLRVIKPPALTPLATLGVPTIAMILLLLLPFYDRGPERHPLRRPIATTAGILTIVVIAYLTYAGADTGSINATHITPPKSLTAAKAQEFRQGELVVGQSGCLACHRIGGDGNNGPGPNLTDVATKVPPGAIRQTLLNPTAPMPSFRNLPPQKLDALVTFLGNLK